MGDPAEEFGFPSVSVSFGVTRSGLREKLAAVSSDLRRNVSNFVLSGMTLDRDTWSEDAEPEMIITFDGIRVDMTGSKSDVSDAKSHFEHENLSPYVPSIEVDQVAGRCDYVSVLINANRSNESDLPNHLAAILDDLVGTTILDTSIFEVIDRTGWRITVYYKQQS